MSDNCCNLDFTIDESLNIPMAISGANYNEPYELPTMSSGIKGGAYLGDGLEVDESERLNIEDGGVTTDKLGDGSVTTDKLVDGAVTADKVDASLLQLFEGNVRAFETVADMQAAELQAGDICHTNGFHASGDGGAAFYKITASGTANGMDVLACGDVFANLVITESYVTPEMFGAYGDGVADDSDNIIRCFSVYENVVLKRTYLVTKQIPLIDNQSVTCTGTLIDNFINVNNGFIKASGKTNVSWHGGTFIGTGARTTSGNSYAVFEFEQCENVKIEKCNFEDINSMYCILFKHSDFCYAIENRIDGYSYAGILCLNVCNNVFIENNYLTGLANNTSANTYPISLSAFDYNLTELTTVGENLFAIGNVIDESDNPWWEGIDAHGGTNIVISNNMVIGCYTGISVVSDETKYRVKNVLISDNICIGPQKNVVRNVNNCGVVCRGKHLVITNNELIGFGKHGSSAQSDCGILIPSADEADGIVSNNLIVDVLHYGISVHGYNMRVFENTISFGDKPEGVSLNNFAFLINTYTHELICEKNLIKKNDYLTNGIATASGDYTYRVVFKENECDSETVSYRNWSIPQVAPAIPSSVGVKAGHVGDVILNSSLSSGNPYGWVCTASATENSDSVWSIMYNLP